MSVTSKSASEQFCPDPSVHEHQHTKNLSEQASTAALYVTHPERNTQPPQVLNPDGKLSSKSAATSLKYAKPQDLPSFPTHGIDTSNSAGQAAMAAKDYKMKELWQPELSAAGSKAALLAHKDGGKLDLWQPSASSEGNSAAKLAMQNKTLSPQLDYGYTKDGRSNALLAATKSQRNGRQRAGSTPAAPAPAYPDSANSAYNALNAATVSHRASGKPAGMAPDGWDSAAMQAARVKNIGDHVSREMYTEHPPVEIEQQEKRDKDALRASAISMAKQMYDAQNKASQQPGQSTSTGGQTDIKQEAMRYIHLQDAAHKLAQERLAKVDKNFETMRYREYYGYNQTPPRSRLSMTGLMRKRASSDTAKDDLDSSDDDDERQARRVRNQMSQLNTSLASVDAKKQQTDRDALMAAAQKRVQQSMLDMDARVFQDTGKVSQAMMDDWEAKAKKRAAADAEKREVNRGKTHIGAGRYMDNSEIEAIASARLQPTLAEIEANAEKRRARDAEIQHEKEEQERFKQQEKQRSKESKEEWKRFKEVEKAEAKKEKEDRKAAEQTDEPEHRRGFLSRLSLRHKNRDSTHQDTDVAATTTQPTAAQTTNTEARESVERHEKPEKNEKVMWQPVPGTETTTKHESTVPASESVAPVEPTKETTADPVVDDEQSKSGKGIKGLFSKIKNRKSHAEEAESSTATPAAATVGSAAKADEQHEKASTAPTPVVAGTVTEPPTLPQQTAGESADHSTAVHDAVAESPSSFRRRSPDDHDADVSSLESSGVDEDDFKEGRTGRAARAMGSKKQENTISPIELTSEKEIDDDDDAPFEEAQDTIVPSPLAETHPTAPAAPKDATQHGRETKFQEVL